MDLFELLFIALFILFPLLEGVLKRKRQSGSGLPEGEEEPASGAEPWADESSADEPWPDEHGADEHWAGASQPSSGSERDPTTASEMVPDDLWSVLTGEERPRPVAVEPEPETEPEPELEPAPEVRPAPARAPRGEPVSLEYRGPEAYSLEKYEREPESLEKPLPSPDVRHRRFHELVDAPRVRRKRRRRGVARALARPDRLREAFVLSEVLGPPKGLE